MCYYEPGFPCALSGSEERAHGRNSFPTATPAYFARNSILAFLLAFFLPFFAANNLDLLVAGDASFVSLCED